VQYLQADGMLCQLEDSDESCDTKKRQRRTGLGAFAAHCRQHVDEPMLLLLLMLTYRPLQRIVDSTLTSVT